jgi:membrane protein YqaA with SNARE-associated domain
MTDTDDPIDEMAAKTLARYALAARALAEAVVAEGVPEALVGEVLARERAKFLAELAAVINVARAACDDPTAVRH